MNAYLVQMWTGIVGMLAYWNWEKEIILYPGMPLTPAIMMLLGWAVIVCKNVIDINHDRTLLARPKGAKEGPFDKKTGESTVASWSAYIGAGMQGRDKIQINYLNSLRLAKHPDDIQTRFQTHHEVLTLIYILQSDASAITKQRALQVKLMKFLSKMISNHELSIKNDEFFEKIIKIIKIINDEFCIEMMHTLCRS